MIYRTGLIVMIGLGLVISACQPKEPKTNKYIKQVQNTEEQDDQYNKCELMIDNLVKHVEMFKKYKKREPRDLAEVAKEYNVKIQCPVSNKYYVYESIVPKPDEEINSENIRAFQDGDDKRTFKITCPHHRIKIYGR